MERFSFSLEKMLGYQSQILEEEKGTLGRLTAERDELETRKSELENKLAAVRADMSRQEAAGTTVFVLRSYCSILDSGRKQLEELTEVLLSVKRRLEKQRQAVTRASQEVKKLEKLRENQLEDYHRREAKEQQEIISEHVANAYIRRGDS